MDVFDLDEKLLYDYRRFARSFILKIRAREYPAKASMQSTRTNRFWPDPLISINPNFEKGSICCGPGEGGNSPSSHGTDLSH